MSDGPHRSLPLPRHWKRFARCASSPAFSSSEVVEALSIALKRDFLEEVPVSKVYQILSGDGQRYLFPEAQADQLEALRDAHPGSVLAETLIDCALDALAKGLQGHHAAHSATAQALEAQARNRDRQIIEHHHRSGGGSPDPSDRLRSARSQLSYSQVATELVSSRATARDLRPTKHSGIDEGPPL